MNNLHERENAAIDIEAAYAEACRTVGDIHEHMPVLRYFAERVVHNDPALIADDAHVVELGVRSVVSTWAFLAARPKRLVSVDIEDAHPECVRACREVCKAADQPWEFVLANSLTLQPIECGLLFIDTLHTYAQLREELLRHGPFASQFIALHDTEKYGEVGDFDTRPGLKAAVNEFLEHPSGQPFEIALHLPNCCGLTVLRRAR